MSIKSLMDGMDISTNEMEALGGKCFSYFYNEIFVVIDIVLKS